MAGDRQTKLPGQRITEPEGLEPEPGQGRELLQLAAGTVSLATFVLYGVQYWAMERFYERFGITPEQVGMDGAALLPRLAVWAASLAFFAFMAFSLCYPPIAAVVGGSARTAWWQRQLARAKVRAGIRRTLLVTVTGCWLGVTVLHQPGVRHLPPLPLSLGVATGLFVAAGALLVVRRAAQRAKPLYEVLVCLLLVVLASGHWIGNTMIGRADLVAHRGEWGLWEQVLGLRPQYVQAEFVRTQGMPTRRDFAGVYLGEAGGVQVLYDCAAREVVRVSVTQVQLVHEVPNSTATAAKRACHDTVPPPDPDRAPRGPGPPATEPVLPDAPPASRTRPARTVQPVPEEIGRPALTPRPSLSVTTPPTTEPDPGPGPNPTPSPGS